jgi:hypothetical protein
MVNIDDVHVETNILLLKFDTSKPYIDGQTLGNSLDAFSRLVKAIHIEIRLDDSEVHIKVVNTSEGSFIVELWLYLKEIGQQILTEGNVSYMSNLSSLISDVISAAKYFFSRRNDKRPDISHIDLASLPQETLDEIEEEMRKFSEELLTHLPDTPTIDPQAYTLLEQSKEARQSIIDLTKIILQDPDVKSFQVYNSNQNIHVKVEKADLRNIIAGGNTDYSPDYIYTEVYVAETIEPTAGKARFVFNGNLIEAEFGEQASQYLLKENKFFGKKTIFNVDITVEKKKAQDLGTTVNRYFIKAIYNHKDAVSDESMD